MLAPLYLFQRLSEWGKITTTSRQWERVTLEKEEAKDMKGSPPSWLLFMPRLNSRAFRKLTSKGKPLTDAQKSQPQVLQKNNLLVSSYNSVDGRTEGDSFPLIRSQWPHPSNGEKMLAFWRQKAACIGKNLVGCIWNQKRDLVLG